MVDSRAIATGILASIAFSLIPIQSAADEVVPLPQIVASISDEQSELVDEVSAAFEPENGSVSAISEIPAAEPQGASVPNIKPLGSIRLVRDMTSKAGKLHLPSDAVRTYEPTELPVDSVELTPWVFYPHPTPRYPITYNPLYFEDPDLERCGTACGVFTDAVSLVHFGGRIPLLPYLMASNCPDSRVHALPDCPACREYDCEAYIPKPTILPVTVQGLAVVGLIFIVP